jgi:hypothetical protein
MSDCEIVMSRGVDDANGYPCGRISIAECRDCGAKLCQLHTEECTLCECEYAQLEKQITSNGGIRGKSALQIRLNSLERVQQRNHTNSKSPSRLDAKLLVAF